MSNFIKNSLCGGMAGKIHGHQSHKEYGVHMGFCIFPGYGYNRGRKD